MEYNLNQLDNAILDVMKDYENDALVDTFTLFEKVKEICPELRNMYYINAEHKFMDHVININKVYDFISPYVRNGHFFLIKSGPHNKASCEKLYGGYMPNHHELKRFDSVIHYHNDYFLLQEKNRLKDVQIRCLQEELDEIKSENQLNNRFNVSLKTALWMTSVGWVAGLFTKYYLTGNFI